MHLIGTSPSKFIPIFEALGAKYIRADLRMNYIYKNGRFDFSAEYYNELITEINKTGAKILAILGSPGNILGSDMKVSSEEELELFNSYVKAVADNYSNIHDFLGNCREWTQEAYYASFRALRGGCYSNTGSNSPATSCSDSNPDYSGYSILSSRATLFIM